MKKLVLPKLRMMAAGIAAWTFTLLWWGVLYPELCFPKDTYEVLYETEGEQEAVSEEEICNQLLHADEEQVIVKSRLFEWLKQ